MIPLFCQVPCISPIPQPWKIPDDSTLPFNLLEFPYRPTSGHQHEPELALQINLFHLVKGR